MSELTFDMVHSAAQLLRGITRKTDIILTHGLTSDCDLRLKTENLQRTPARFQKKQELCLFIPLMILILLQGRLQ